MILFYYLSHIEGIYICAHVVQRMLKDISSVL